MAIRIRISFMKTKKLSRSIAGILILMSLCIGGYLLYNRGRPAPVPMKQKLYEGIVYRRVVRVLPRPMVAHVLSIDTKEKGIEFLVTPPDSEGEQPLNARTTSQFLEEFDLQVAVNGDKFLPWWSRSPADYYPHVGDPVAPSGFTASNGKVYWLGNLEDVGVEPTLYISRRNVLAFNNQPNRVYNAISGDRMIVVKGQAVPDLNDKGLEPRTAIGVNRNGRYLYIVVVDGRQPFYSEGATFADLAELLIDQGVYMGMSLDGGGSSTLVIEGRNGKPVLLNSPIDSYLPGRERPVGNHLGIYVK
jgi:hypothetical protein